MEIVSNVISEEERWEHRRYETAKEFMTVIMGRANFDPLTAHFSCCCASEAKPTTPYLWIAEISVNAADALIEKLKGEDEDGVRK